MRTGASTRRNTQTAVGEYRVLSTINNTALPAGTRCLNCGREILPGQAWHRQTSPDFAYDVILHADPCTLAPVAAAVVGGK